MNSVPILTRRSRRATSAAALLAAALAAASSARAQVTPFVDAYKTNVSSNNTASTNAVINLLSGFEVLWTPGATWDTGTPTTIGAGVLKENIQYVIDVTHNRTDAQATLAYLVDRRNQSYSAIAGLGSLANDYYAGSGAFTTILDVAADATTSKYDDKGNGAGSTSSALGSVVTLVNTLRGNYSSTTPPKNYYLYGRPWRLDDNGLPATSTGNESTGYYTSTLSDGTPNTSTAQTFFPDYNSSVIVAPTLLAARSTNPLSDGGQPSGHTNALYLADLALAYAVPERFDTLVLEASTDGDARILAGMHSPLDVIGGRIEATALAAAILNDSDNAAIKSAAYTQAQSYFASDLASDTPMSQADWVANKNLYTFRMTYGLSQIGDTTVAASVPKGAEVLLETRFGYLDADQRREVLRTTAIASGQPLEDAEGWSRLNLYAASGGYGRFDSDVTVNMDASQGGTSARDHWRNDISGTGGLTKLGTGTLVLDGNSSYTGATHVSGGALFVNGSLASQVTVDSGATLGGNGVFESMVTVGDGGLMDIGDGVGTMTFDAGLALGNGTQLTFQLGTVSDEILVTNGLLIGCDTAGGVTINIEAADGFAAGTYTLFSFVNGQTQSFDASDFSMGSTVSGFDYALNLTGDSLQITVTSVPEPATYAFIGGIVGLVAVTLRRRRRSC